MFKFVSRKLVDSTKAEVKKDIDETVSKIDPKLVGLIIFVGLALISGGSSSTKPSVTQVINNIYVGGK